MRRLAVGGLVWCALVAAAAPAQARVVQAETVLPPGQSGQVSIPGVASGTGSPHLTDQTGLFTSFRYKSALFNRPGTTTTPRAGVRIVRDAYGVPSITAGSDYDAWWGVGYAVAQDRMFQLELFRRATSGRLAEILGPDYLDDDLISRRDYYTDGEVDGMVARIPGGLRGRLEAYRDGINAWIAHLRSSPAETPGEFIALGVPLRDWTSRDSARLGIYLARTVPSSDGVELDNARVLRAIGPKAFSALLPIRSRKRVSTVPRANGLFPSQPGRTRKQERAAYKRSRRFLRGLALPAPPAAATGASAKASASRFLPRGGSYMWAISKRRPAVKPRKARKGRKGRRGRKAKAGPAFLFNGPQLGYSIPELFVEFELHSPQQNVRGVSAAGIPVLAIGHNERLAWGYTSGLSDEDDLYAERLTGTESYRYKGSTRQMSCRNERFDYRTPPTDLPGRLTDILGNPGSASGSRTERICRTVHGPVQERASGLAYARRYAVWGRELETIVGLRALSDAQSVKQADRALLEVTWNENVIAADDRGNIGYWHPGLHPLRPRNYDERLPYPGTGEAEWRGFLPRRKTPHVINPRQGFLFNWNNLPSYGWTNGDSEARERLAGPYHRSAYLRKLVARVKKRGVTYERSRAIDRSSGTIAQQRPLFGGRLRNAHKVTRGSGRAVLAALMRWNGSYAATNGAGTVNPGVAIWEELKSQAQSAVLGRYGAAVQPLAGRPGTSHMFDISNGEAYAFRVLTPRRLGQVAASAGAALSKRFGTSDISRWREPRRMYDVSAQGAASPPDLPFFDRGTWEQSVALAP